jgi:hypothetical protein
VTLPEGGWNIAVLNGIERDDFLAADTLILGIDSATPDLL